MPTIVDHRKFYVTVIVEQEPKQVIGLDDETCDPVLLDSLQSVVDLIDQRHGILVERIELPPAEQKAVILGHFNLVRIERSPTAPPLDPNDTTTIRADEGSRFYIGDVEFRPNEMIGWDQVVMYGRAKTPPAS